MKAPGLRAGLGFLAFPGVALILAALVHPLRPAERRLAWRERLLPPSPTVVLSPQSPEPAQQLQPVPEPALPAAKKAPVLVQPSVGDPELQAIPYPAEASREALLGRFPPLQGQAWTEVDGEAALWLHAQGALFLDARRSEAFRAGHIPGARSLPAWEANLAERIQRLAMLAPDPRLPVVIYCSGGDCQDSHLVAEALRPAGFVNLRIYREGYPEWVTRGGKVAVKGAGAAIAPVRPAGQASNPGKPGTEGFGMPGVGNTTTR